MKESLSQRPESTPAELETRELEWWREFAELEQRVTWVQTPGIQQIVRGHYVREIVKYSGRSGRILELGCGGGWLCFALAESGAKEIVGVDFSSSQIDIAQRRVKAKGLENRIHFVCTDGTENDLLEGTFDCVIVHAFLHHLDRSEIRRSLASVPRLLKQNGTFIVFEPILHEGRPELEVPIAWRIQDKLIQLANLGQRRGIRRMTPEEKHWRDLFARRSWGIPPHGPSPKEMPFATGELENYLSTDFIVEQQAPCMLRSHHVAQEWLFREISHPWTTRLLLPWIARAAHWLDRPLLKQIESLPDYWIFNMFICRVRDNNP